MAVSSDRGVTEVVACPVFAQSNSLFRCRGPPFDCVPALFAVRLLKDDFEGTWQRFLDLLARRTARLGSQISRERARTQRLAPLVPKPGEKSGSVEGLASVIPWPAQIRVSRKSVE